MAIFLETQRLMIRLPTLDEINKWVALHCVEEDYSPEIIQEWLESDIAHFEKHGFGMGSVYEKNNHTFIGRAGLVYLDHDDTQPDIEVGYVLQKTQWNKGYATELAQAIIEWGFNYLPIHKLVAVTRPGNRKSQHVLEKAGMKFIKIATFRDEDFLFYEIYKKNK